MKKTAKPVTIGEARSWINPKFSKTIYYHKITFDNGDSGEFSTSASPQVKFTVGVEATYTIEPKTKDGVVIKDKFGKETYIIDIFKENTFGGGFKKKMTKPYEARSIAASVALECAELLLSKKPDITPEILMKCADRLYLYLISDNILYTQEVERWEAKEEQLAIQKQSALRRAATGCSLLSITTANDLIALSDKYFEYIKFKSNM